MGGYHGVSNSTKERQSSVVESFAMFLHLHVLGTSEPCVNTDILLFPNAMSAGPLKPPAHPGRCKVQNLEVANPRTSIPGARAPW
jgi:hypothetical protein